MAASRCDDAVNERNYRVQQLGMGRLISRPGRAHQAAKAHVRIFDRQNVLHLHSGEVDMGLVRTRSYPANAFAPLRAMQSRTLQNYQAAQLETRQMRAAYRCALQRSDSLLCTERLMLSAIRFIAASQSGSRKLLCNFCWHSSALLKAGLRCGLYFPWCCKAREQSAGSGPDLVKIMTSNVRILRTAWRCRGWLTGPGFGLRL